MGREEREREREEGVGSRERYKNRRLGSGVVVIQFIARLLPIPEDPGSNPVIRNFY